MHCKASNISRFYNGRKVAKHLSVFAVDSSMREFCIPCTQLFSLNI